MAHKDVFDVAAGPYTPAAHEEYGLLPRCREEGREVFSYPSEIDAVEVMLRAAEGIADSGEEGRKSLLIPHGKASYAAYLDELRGYADRHRCDSELSEALEWLIDAIKRLNVKEEWSVVRYVGHEYDGDAPGLGLTRGRCCYWPCTREHPVYEGVIDDEDEKESAVNDGDCRRADEKCRIGTCMVWHKWTAEAQSEVPRAKGDPLALSL